MFVAGVDKNAYDEKYDDITRKIKQEKKNEPFMILMSMHKKMLVKE